MNWRRARPASRVNVILVAFLMLSWSSFSTSGCNHSPTEPDSPPQPTPTPAPTPRPTATPQPGGSSTLTFVITDSCSDSLGLQVRFFDTTHSVWYPSASTAYTVASGGTGPFPISVPTGSTVCFGAETNPSNGGYWGVGLNNSRGCAACCYTAAGSSTVNLPLACSASSPTPTVPPPTPTTPPSSTVSFAWTVQDGCNDGRGVQLRFFDEVNNLVFPNASQVYVIGSNQQGTISMTVLRSAKLCLGATTDPVTSASWGVGISNTTGCSACCQTFPATGSSFTTSTTLTCGGGLVTGVGAGSVVRPGPR